MSLATPDGARPVSFLPSIKCSTCGDEIEIAAMGDHVCAGEVPEPLTTRSHTPNMSNPFTLRQLNASGQWPTVAPSPLQQSNSEPAVPQSRARNATLSSNQSVPSKASRIALPKINPDAANRPYLAPRPTGLDSPLSPGTSVRSGKPGFQRSMTSPMPRLFDPRPPSPELSANLDCAFPPWPSLNAPPRPPTSQGRRTPNGSDRAPSRGASRFDQSLAAEVEPFSLEPKSPNANASESVLQKLNTLKSGPFASNRRQGTGDSNGPSSIDSRRPSAPSVEPPIRPATAQSNRSQPTRRPSTSLSNRGIHETTSAAKKLPPPRPARPDDEILSPSFLDQFSAEPASVLPLAIQKDESDTDRGHTFPFPNMSPDRPDSQTLSKARSEPELRKPSQSISKSQLPVRRDSRAGTRVDYRMQDAPPVPKPIVQYHEAGNHTPSDSASSLTSITHSTSDTKSTHSSNGPSPIGSSTSSVDAFGPFDDSTRSDGMRVAGLNVRNPQKPGERAELPKQSSPPRTLTKPVVPRETPQKTIEIPFTQPLESPMDPALQARAGPSSQWATYEPWGSAPEKAVKATEPETTHRDMSSESQDQAPAALSIPRQPDVSSVVSRMAISPVGRSVSPTSSAGPEYSASSVAAASSRTQSPSAPRPPPVPREQSRPRTPGRRPTNAKPMCRGCGQLIEGKSVKAADGRLTGRWHKACFVCKSCTKPFVTADFYVINNEPYCEHDYHEQNGSLCHGCHRGIEGQYLETTSSTRFGSVDKKFHPRCFTCWECRTVLSEDYFEITGRVFCERHALAAMRAQARRGGPGGALQPPGRRDMVAERRTTRLINPIMA